MGIYECFDGDAPEAFDKKQKTLADFNAGLNNYLNKNFAEAIIDFKKVITVDPDDNPAHLFLKKSIGYLSNGIEKEWTGVEKMTKK